MFHPTSQPTALEMNQCAVGFLRHLSYARLPCTSVLNRSIKVAPISVSLVVFHFLILSCPSLLPDISQIRGYLTSEGSRSFIACCIPVGMDLRTSNRAAEVKDILCFWGLCDKRSYLVVTADCRAYLICSRCMIKMSMANHNCGEF